MVNLKLFAGVSFSFLGFCLGLSYWDIVSQPVYSNTIPWNEFFDLMILAIFRTKMRIISLVGASFCSLLLIGKVIQLLFFGNLRTEESRKIHDRVVNYILFKIVFSGVILELLHWESILTCVMWFTVLGFLKNLTLLCGDRLHFLITAVNIHSSKHTRIFVLLNAIFLLDFAWFISCFYLFDTTYDVYLILTFECLILGLDTSHNIIRYLVSVVFESRIGWETRNKYLYMTELITDVVGLTLTFAHYCQMLYMHGISFTFIDAVLFLNMRKVFNRLWQKIQAHINYKKLARALDSVFPTVSRKDFESGEHDNICLICRDEMEIGKKLPCSHVFHESCILSWLEQQNTCPYCREPLMQNLNIVNPPQNPPAQRPVHHQGNRFMNWLPRVEIRPFDVTPDMVEAVHEVAPHIPVEIIRQDLAATGSVNLTISNIFEGRIQIPEVAEGDQILDHEQPAPSSPNRVSPATVEIENVHSLSEEILRLESSMLSAPSGYGSSPSERQKILEDRKKALQQQSRLRYLKKLQEKREKEKNQDNQDQKKYHIELKKEPESELVPSPNLTPFSMEDPVDVRRRRAIEAAERRRQTAK